MILIADGGSTKADWIALDANKNERFRVKTFGVKPCSHFLRRINQ